MSTTFLTLKIEHVVALSQTFTITVFGLKVKTVGFAYVFQLMVFVLLIKKALIVF